MRRKAAQRAVAAFTLVELLIVLALSAILVALGAPALHRLITRSRIEGQARNLSVMMARARSEALTRGVPTVVVQDGSAFVSFADVHGSTKTSPPDGVYNPQAGEPQYRTDWQIERQTIKVPVTLDGPGGQPAVAGFTNPGVANGRAVFNPDGSAAATGAFRLRDEAGNFLEVAVEPRATGQVVLRKWDGSAWKEQGQGGGSWEWN